jgi:hypothetical protein
VHRARDLVIHGLGGRLRYAAHDILKERRKRLDDLPNQSDMSDKRDANLTIWEMTTMDEERVNDDNLRFFNRLSGQILVELTEPPDRISPSLENMKASPSAQLRSLTIEWEILEDAGFRQIAADEWTLPVIRAAKIRLRAYGCDAVIEHTAPDGSLFTVRDRANAVECTERKGRADTSWFDGIDVHHVFFDGIHQDADGIWHVRCGS